MTWFIVAIVVIFNVAIVACCKAAGREDREWDRLTGAYQSEQAAAAEVVA